MKLAIRADVDNGFVLGTQRLPASAVSGSGIASYKFLVHGSRAFLALYDDRDLVVQDFVLAASGRYNPLLSL